MAKSFPNTGATTGLAADRTAMTGMYAGQQFYETDTKKLYVYDGSSWTTPILESLGVVTGANAPESQATVEIRKDNAGGLGPSLVLRNVSNTANTSADIKFSTDGTSAWDGTSARIFATKIDGASFAGRLDLAIWNSTLSNEQVALSLRNGRTADSGTSHSGVVFNHAGVAIDRGWANYPSLTVMRTSSSGYDNSSTYAEFRVHGTSGTTDSYPASSGADFGCNFRIDGATYSSSDQRKKTNIEPITNALDSVMSLQGVMFNTVNKELQQDEERSLGGKRYGFIAQDASNAIPNAVNHYPEEDEPLENGYCNAFSVDYGGVVAVLTEAIKEQQAMIVNLQERIAELESA